MINMSKRKSIYSSLNKIFFNNSNFLFYNLHRTIYRKIICKVNNDEEVLEFHNNGFFKSENCKEYVMKIKPFLEKQMPNNDKSYFRYTINEEIKENTTIINSFLIKEIRKYFGNPIFLSDCQIKRNYSMRNYLTLIIKRQ